MITVRRSADRGQTRVDWLYSRHTFSFGQYHDPQFKGYRTLRVLNEDFVQPEGGFHTHPHRDMEILTLVLQGSVEHKDTMGNQSVIHSSELQLMSAGSGIQHSEFNPSETETAHFLQIWIIPERTGIKPSYQQKIFPERERRNQLRLVASKDGREHSFRIHQDADVYLSLLEKDKEMQLSARPHRGIWVQVASGEISLSGVLLKAGDGASIENEEKLLISAKEDSEFLLFDLV